MAAQAALPQDAGAPNGANENQDQHAAAGTRRAAHEHPCDWPDHGVEPGLGSGRGAALLFDQKGQQNAGGGFNVFPTKSYRVGV